MKWVVIVNEKIDISAVVLSRKSKYIYATDVYIPRRTHARGICLTYSFLGVYLGKRKSALFSGLTSDSQISYQGEILSVSNTRSYFVIYGTNFQLDYMISAI